KHGAPDLTWSVTMENYANDYLRTCSKGHNYALLNAGKAGENIASGFSAGTDFKSWEWAVNAWYDREIGNYNYNKPSWNDKVGHFTQLVWKGTTSVGCGKILTCGPGTAPSGKKYPNVYRYLCNYYPPGNQLAKGPNGNLIPDAAAYKENVLPIGSRYVSTLQCCNTARI
ncbi:hypothetical protein KVV02_005518, partial [Mortierella alpina]